MTKTDDNVAKTVKMLNLFGKNRSEAKGENFVPNKYGFGNDLYLMTETDKFLELPQVLICTLPC